MPSSKCLLPFEGQGLDVSVYDAIGTLRVSQSLLNLEEDLFDTKWWDYRLLHPTEATYCFIGMYSRIYKECYGRDIDWREAQEKKRQGFSYPDQLKYAIKGQVTSWWKARQAADLIGARYSIFIRSIFTHAKLQGWKEYPRPQHLYGEGCLEAAVAAWESEKEAYLQIPESPLYRADCQHPFKGAFDRSIIAAAQRRGTGPMVIPKMIESGLLSKVSVHAILKSARN